MTTYINKLNKLTVEEMPKAPSNFSIITTTDNGNTTFDMSWINNMDSDTFPEDSNGGYFLVLQKWNDLLNEFESHEDYWNLTTTGTSITVDSTSRASRYRIAVCYYDNVLNQYTDVYPSQTIIAYANRIEPQKITNVEVDTTYSYGQFSNGYKFIESDLGSTSYGYFQPWIKMTNPNIGAGYYGNMRIYQIISEDIISIIQEETNQVDALHLQGTDSIPFKMYVTTTGQQLSYNIRIDDVNENLITKGDDTIILSPLGSVIPDFNAASDLFADEITSTSFKLNWTLNCNGTNVSQRIMKNNAIINPSLGYNVNYKTITDLSPNTSYTFKIRTFKAGMYKYSEEITVTTNP